MMSLMEHSTTDSLCLQLLLQAELMVWTSSQSLSAWMIRHEPTAVVVAVAAAEAVVVAVAVVEQ